LELNPSKIQSCSSLAFKHGNSNENINIKLKKDYFNQTPFQRIETRNLFQKSLIKQKVLCIQNKNYDFNINTNLVMKNIKLENINNIEKQIIAYVIERAENLEKFKQTTEKEDSISISPIRPQGVSLKRYFSSKQKLFKNASESLRDLNKNLATVRKIDNTNIIVIKDYKDNLNSQIQAKKLLSKGKTATNFFAPLEISKKNTLAEVNKILKNQFSENTEFYFYNKNENNKNNSELRNYFGYKKRPQTNNLNASPGISNEKRRTISSKNFGFSAENNGNNKGRAASRLSKNKDLESERKGVIFINRKHASVQYKDLSKEIQVVKVGNILLNKLKNF